MCHALPCQNAPHETLTSHLLKDYLWKAPSLLWAHCRSISDCPSRKRALKKVIAKHFTKLRKMNMSLSPLRGTPSDLHLTPVWHVKLWCDSRHRLAITISEESIKWNDAGEKTWNHSGMDVLPSLSYWLVLEFICWMQQLCFWTLVHLLVAWTPLTNCQRRVGEEYAAPNIHCPRPKEAATQSCERAQVHCAMLWCLLADCTNCQWLVDKECAAPIAALDQKKLLCTVQPLTT